MRLRGEDFEEHASVEAEGPALLGKVGSWPSRKFVVFSGCPRVLTADFLVIAEDRVCRPPRSLFPVVCSKHSLPVASLFPHQFLHLSFFDTPTDIQHQHVQQETYINPLET